MTSIDCAARDAPQEQVMLLAHTFEEFVKVCSHKMKMKISFAYLTQIQYKKDWYPETYPITQT